eukprot:9291365-Alexandrium_andersonii.AAC.1
MGSFVRFRTRASSRCRVQGTRRTTLVVWSVALGAPYGARNARRSSCRACHGRRPGVMRCRAQGTRRATLVVWSVALGAPCGARDTRHLS